MVQTAFYLVAGSRIVNTRNRLTSVSGFGREMQSRLLPLASIIVFAIAVAANAQTVTGPLMEWQSLTLDFSGPLASELGGQSNPFLDWRLNVTFTHSETGTNYTVPGFFAGDGEGGATGSVWRTRFTPDDAGDWTYAIYLPNASDSGNLHVYGIDGQLFLRWFNPRSGQFEGSESRLTGDGDVALGQPPSASVQDWVALVTVQRFGGDVNSDGIVDVIDLGTFATNYGVGSGAEWSDGDFTGDGAVDVADLGIMATNYGKSMDLADQAVPEPGTFTLLFYGLVSLLFFIRRR